MTTTFTPISFLVQDEFAVDVAAGAVNGTLATDGTNTRTIVDTNGKSSITGGALSIATGGVGLGDPGIWYPSKTRVAGLGIFSLINYNTGGFEVGADSNQASSINESIRVTATTLQVRFPGSAITVGAVALSTVYSMALVLRSSGCFYFIRGGTFTNWTLIYVSATGTNNGFASVIASGATSVHTAEYLRAFSTGYLPSPLISDGFASVFGTSDGLGHAEGIATGIGSGGGSIVWLQPSGTWTVGSGKANASALSGGVAVAVADSGNADVIIKVKLTISAGVAGAIVRYVDASNYVYAYHNGASNQVTLRKVVAGVDSQVMALTAATYSAGAELIVVCDVTKFRVFFNSLAVGSEQTISDSALQLGTKQGLYTTDTGNQFDDFVVYVRGTGGEYNTSLNIGTTIATAALAASSTSSTVLSLVHKLTTAAASSTSTSSAILSIVHQLISACQAQRQPVAQH